jgi:hypothetical protein
VFVFIVTGSSRAYDGSLWLSQSGDVWEATELNIAFWKKQVQFSLKRQSDIFGSRFIVVPLYAVQ